MTLSLAHSPRKILQNNFSWILESAEPKLLFDPPTARKRGNTPTIVQRDGEARRSRTSLLAKEKAKHLSLGRKSNGNRREDSQRYRRTPSRGIHRPAPFLEFERNGEKRKKKRSGEKRARFGIVRGNHRSTWRRWAVM